MTKIKIPPLVVGLHAPLVAHTFNIQIIDDGEYCHGGVGDDEVAGYVVDDDHAVDVDDDDHAVDVDENEYDYDDDDDDFGDDDDDDDANLALYSSA